MHFVDCRFAPKSLEDIAKTPKGFGDPDAYGKFIPDLKRCFKGLCGYCERRCHRPPRGEKPSLPEHNTVDHFKPYSRFPDLTYSWENLVYACLRCNKVKNDQFPAGEKDNSRLDDLKEQLNPRSFGPLKRAMLSKERIEERIEDTKRSDAEIKDFEFECGRTFAHPSESDGYVNPRDRAEKDKKFFIFDHQGRILPNPDLDDREWSKAVRTICDLDLNATLGSRGPRRGSYRKTDLCGLRKAAFTRWQKEDRPPRPFQSFVDWASSNALN